MPLVDPSDSPCPRRATIPDREARCHGALEHWGLRLLALVGDLGSLAPGFVNLSSCGHPSREGGEAMEGRASPRNGPKSLGDPHRHTGSSGYTACRARGRQRRREEQDTEPGVPGHRATETAGLRRLPLSTSLRSVKITRRLPPISAPGAGLRLPGVSVSAGRRYTGSPASRPPWRWSSHGR